MRGEGRGTERDLFWVACLASMVRRPSSFALLFYRPVRVGAISQGRGSRRASLTPSHPQTMGETRLWMGAVIAVGGSCLFSFVGPGPLIFALRKGAVSLTDTSPALSNSVSIHQCCFACISPIISCQSRVAELSVMGTIDTLGRTGTYA
ncbi:hypothetical protein K449DRAFT_24284 [Hypoxylon sp. EC38]|nr:hypothetical protein K449DRAFT_24284 [Hypoxylon sp. EC38]